MRLTLRTLLAWLDDTLPPGEVRQIGMQVNESPFARELGERIQKVARQRRLSVPGSSGPDGTDPALVAAYLDNELSPEAVTEFEKRCLTSDVHLAEVASVHQILSLIGQKAKVPSEARHRMYHLVKGREAVSSSTPRTFAPTPSAEAEPAAAPLPPWTPPDLPSRSPWERFGLPAAVAALLLALVGSAWWLAVPAEPARDPATIAATTPADAASKAPEKPEPKEDPKAADASLVDGDASKKAETLPESPAPAEKPKPPAGLLGVVGKGDGVLLRYNPAPEARGWDRLAADAGLKADDRVAGLDPFRTPVISGESTVEVVGGTEIRIHNPEAGEAARFELAQGRVVLRGGTPPIPIGVRFANQAVVITPPPGAAVGVERTAHRGSGELHALPSLRIYIPEGEATLATAGGTERVAGPGFVALQAAGKLTPKVSEPAPGWVADSGPSPVEQELGRLFGKYFSKANPILTDLAEALEDKQPEVRRLALSGLETIGEIDMIVVAMSNPDNAPTRRGAIAVLRSFAARGPDAVKELRTRLQQTVGPDLAPSYEKLLAGYSPKEAAEEATYIHLVKLLKSPELGIRELALDNLQTLTGRDSLEYNPDKFEGPGLSAWQELLKRKELIGKAPPKPE